MREFNLSAAIRPYPGECTEQRALPRTRCARHEDMTPARKCQCALAEERGTVRQYNGEVLKHKSIIRTLRAHDVAPYLRGFFHVLRKARKSLDHGGELSNGAVRIDKEGERILHAPKRRHRLHETAERHFAGVIARCRHDDRENDRELTIAVDVEVQELCPAHQSPIVLYNVCKTLLEPNCLRHFTAIKCDALAVFAHAHHAETKICLVTLLIEVEPNEPTPDDVNKVCSNPRIEQRQPEHIAVDGERTAA